MNRDFFDFHGTKMRVGLPTMDSNGAYAIIEMIHPPNVGPALHVHPRGPESFFILEGSYTFVRGSETLMLAAGQAVCVPAGTPHRYTAGPAGGQTIVICPPGLEQYFQTVASLLKCQPLPIAEEFTIASRHGQDFLDRSSHWI